MLEAITVLTLAYVRFFTLYKHITVVMRAVTLDFLSVLCNLGIVLRMSIYVFSRENVAS